VSNVFDAVEHPNMERDPGRHHDASMFPAESFTLLESHHEPISIHGRGIKAHTAEHTCKAL
jgi:hypothetical protein